MPNEYQTIAVDPPWAETGGGKYKRGADRHYPVLKPHQILEAILGSPLWRPADTCHLWMWTTINSMPNALDLIHALGFTYKTHMAWVKVRTPVIFDGAPYYRLTNPGLGHYVRGVHELCLLATRGRCRSLSREVPSVLMASRLEHSRKPGELFAKMTEISPGPRAELFARGWRPGWDCWGKVDGEEVTYLESEMREQYAVLPEADPTESA